MSEQEQTPHKELEEYVPGDTAILVECGGAAECKIMSASRTPEWVGFRIEFTRIIVQYPYKHYYVGDEIEIGYRPPKYGGWEFFPDESHIGIMRTRMPDLAVSNPRSVARLEGEIE